MPNRLATLGAVLLLAALEAGAQSPVRVETVSERAIVQQVAATGTVTSPRTAVLSTAVAGLVTEMLVDEGHQVETGEALLSLDDELARLALERVQAEVRQRETELADARRRFDEAEQVGTQRGIARTTIESLRAEVSSDSAAVAAAQATAREQQAIFERHTLKAPFAGVVSRRLTELGEWVNPGDGLLELVATENLRFDFRMSQRYFGELTLDTPVEIMLDAAPGQTLDGRIAAIVPVKNPGSRTFLVRVLAAASNGQAITSGMSASARFSLGTGRTGIAVSRDAILRFPDGRVTVWVVGTDNEIPAVREQIVQTGLEFDGLVEIRAGLADGERVVVRGNETLQQGQRVTILDAAR